MCGKHPQQRCALAGYVISLVDEIMLYKEACEAPFPLLLPSVILFVPSGSCRRVILMPLALGILVSAE